MERLQGRTAFVTGGASGIGLAISQALLAAGAKVVIADLRQDHLDQALEGFAQAAQADLVHGVRLDVTDRLAMAAAAEETERVFGKVHILVNNAGVGVEGPVKDATYADWDFGVDVNLKGPINGVVTFLPRILAHGEGGHIVNTASMAGAMPPPPNLVIYSTTKGGLVSLSEALRAELQDQGVGVSVLLPGPFKTNINQLGRNRPQKYAATGYGETEARLAERQDPPFFADPSLAGEMVVRAIRENRLYIVTHGEFELWTRTRHDALLAAFPEERDAELSAALGLDRPPPLFRP